MPIPAKQSSPPRPQEWKREGKLWACWCAVEKSHTSSCMNEVEHACMSCMHLYDESTNVDALRSKEWGWGSQHHGRQGLHSVDYILCCNPALTSQIDDYATVALAQGGFTQTFLSNGAKENAEPPPPHPPPITSLLSCSLTAVHPPPIASSLLHPPPVRPHPRIL